MEITRKARQSFCLQDLINDVKSVLPGWAAATESNTSISRLTGMTNISFKISCSEPSVDPPVLVYRQFGSLEGFLDKETENYIFEFIGQAGLGPRFYHKNEVFRLEEFVVGEHPSPSEFGSAFFRRLMMKYLADFHRINPVKLDRVPKFASQLDEGIKRKKKISPNIF
jgi:hypothetical protein